MHGVVYKGSQWHLLVDLKTLLLEDEVSDLIFFFTYDRIYKIEI